MSHWWDIHVLLPCRQPGSPFHFIQKIEGTTLLPLPQGMTSFASSTGSSRDAPSGAPHQNRQSKNHPSKRQKTNHVWSAPPQGAGAPWQDNKGGKGHNNGGGKGRGGGGGGGKNGGKHQQKGAGKSSKK